MTSAEKDERAYWFEDTPTLDPAIIPDDAKAGPEPERRYTQNEIIAALAGAIGDLRAQEAAQSPALAIRMPDQQHLRILRDLAIAADTAELMLRPYYPGEAASLHAKVKAAKEITDTSICKTCWGHGWIDDDKGGHVCANCADHITNDAQAEQQTPIAWTNKMQLSFLKDPAYAEIPMAMWGKSCAYADIPLYAAQPPAAPVETVAPKPGNKNCKHPRICEHHGVCSFGCGQVQHSSAATSDDEFRACQIHWPEPYGSTIGSAADEIDRLRHDIERHIQIAADLCNDVPQRSADNAAAQIEELQQRVLAHERLHARIAQALGRETWRGDLADAVRAALTSTEPQGVPVTAEVQEGLAASLKAWDAYGGFDSREDTANKANAMAKAIRAYLAPHLSTGELK